MSKVTEKIDQLQAQLSAQKLLLWELAMWDDAKEQLGVTALEQEGCRWGYELDDIRNLPNLSELRPQVKVHGRAGTIPMPGSFGGWGGHITWYERLWPREQYYTRLTMADGTVRIFNTPILRPSCREADREKRANAASMERDRASGGSECPPP